MQTLQQETQTKAQGFSTRWTPVFWQLTATVVGFIFGGGQVFDQAAPFGIAYLLACSRGYLLAGALGTAAGALAMLPHELAAQVLLGCAAVLAARLIWKEDFRLWAAGGSMTLFLGQLLSDLYLPGVRLDFRNTLLTAVIGVLLGYGLLRLPARQSAGACLWLCALAAAVEALGFFLFQPGLILMALALVTLAWRGSQSQTAIMACGMSMAIGAASPQFLYLAVSLCGAALLAHCAAPGRRLICGGLFGCTAVLGALTQSQMGLKLVQLATVAAALALYLLLPLQRLEIQEVLPTKSSRNQGQNVKEKLEKVAEALTDMADTVNRVSARQSPKGETYTYVIDYVAENLCRRCARRENCWVSGYSGTIDGFYKLKPMLEAGLRPQEEQLPENFGECVHREALCRTVGRAYGNFRSRRESRVKTRTMRKILTEQYNAMAASLADLAAQLSWSSTFDGAVTVRTQRLFSGLGLEPLECEAVKDGEGHWQVAVTVARIDLTQTELEELAQEVSALCRRPMEAGQLLHGTATTRMNFRERPRLRPTFGAFYQAAEEMCGDVSLHFCDDSGKAYLLLCDGMGAGRPAALDGTMAAQLTARLLRSGLGGSTAARLVNVALALKSEEESSATLDLLTTDLYTGRATLLKAGAAPSFLLREGRVKQLEGDSLPVGILPQVSGATIDLELAPGDQLVMVSDGVLADGPEWVRQQLSLFAGQDLEPNRLAQALVDSARRKSSAARPDDMTVLVCRIEAEGR